MPSIVTHNWLSDPSIISNQDTNITVQPTNFGVNTYTFSVEDNFGCTYDTTITVITQQPGNVNLTYRRVMNFINSITTMFQQQDFGLTLAKLER